MLSILFAALLPWLRTGNARRSAFGLTRSAAALGLLGTWPRKIFAVVIFLIPLAVAGAWTAGALRRPMLVASLGGLLGATSLIAGSIALSQLPRAPGSLTAVVAGSAVLGSAGWLARETWISRA